MGSFMLAGFGAWVVSRWGSTIGLLDKANHRSSHNGVVPKGGGIGLLATFFLAVWVLAFPVFFGICVGLVSLLSLYSDRHEISPKSRLCMQFALAIGLMIGLLYWEGRSWSAYLLIPLFSAFVVGTANYYNFMDGINGIAAITGVVGFGLVAVFAGFAGANETYMTLALCMVSACVGFLPFNMPSARVFMGDVGSVLLGFVFAGLVVGLARSVSDFVVLCSFLFPFYADELTTEYVRLRDGEIPEVRGQRSEVRGRKAEGGTGSWLADWKMRLGLLATPHRRHVYQLLANEMGIAHWKVSVGYGVLQAVVGLGALGVRGYGTLPLVGYLGAWFVGFWGFGNWVRSRSADYADSCRYGSGNPKAQS